MKFTLLLTLAWIMTGVSVASAAPLGIYQHGTVVRMRMGDCMLMHRGFISAFGPPQAAASEESCPEYTLVTDKVVFLIVGKSSNQLVPLAEVIDFRFQNKEVAVRVDDARKESKFAIKEMTLRSEWERIQRHIEDQLNDSPHRGVDTALALRSRE
ncbi:MAG: hypothetical protein ABR920_05505 [Terriglobales bacterium]|jgi:hypothetical protein